MNFRYPARIIAEEGFFTVTFRDIPSALTDGATYEEACIEASDCLGESLASYIIDNEELPRPSPMLNEEILITPPALIVAKAIIYAATKKKE